MTVPFLRCFLLYSVSHSLRLTLTQEMEMQMDEMAVDDLRDGCNFDNCVFDDNVNKGMECSEAMGPVCELDLDDI